MAINETIKDLINYPNKSKTVTLDIQKVIPVDNEGDEVYVISATPGTGVTRSGGINPVFVRDFKAGFARSSGLKEPPFTIASGNNAIRISLDGSAYQPIVLASGIGLSGDSIALDIQDKLEALGAYGQAQANNVAFLNATVEFKNNRFSILTGSVSNTYVGTGKSSVAVLDGLLSGGATTLGFDIPITSESIASQSPTQVYVSSPYVSGTTLNISSSNGLSPGQAFMVTDGTSKEYFVAQSVGVGTLAISGAGLANDYAAGSLVQKIFERDPVSDVASPYTRADDIIKFALRAVANQIDFAQ